MTFVFLPVEQPAVIMRMFLASIFLLILPIIRAQVPHWGPCPEPEVQPAFTLRQVKPRALSRSPTFLLNNHISFCIIKNKITSYINIQILHLRCLSFSSFFSSKRQNVIFESNFKTEYI